MIALQFRFLSIFRLCKTSKKFLEICNSGKLWESKLQRDFGPILGLTSDTVRNIKELLQFAARYNLPIPGAEIYGNIISLTDSAFKTRDQKIINYFVNKFPITMQNKLAELAGKYNNKFIINRLLTNPTLSSAVLIGEAEGGHLDVVKQMMNSGSNLNELLQAAAKGGQLDVINFLMSRLNQNDLLASINSVTIIAAKYGHVNVVHEMVQRGADFSTIRIAIDLAAEAGYLDVIIELTSNVPYYLDETYYLNEALIIAAENGHLEVVQGLIDNGATNLNAALIIAVRNGQMKIVNELIRRGATNTREAIEEAASERQWEIVLYLLRQGVRNFDTKYVRQVADHFGGQIGQDS